MIETINRFFVWVFSGILRFARRVVETDQKLYLILGMPWMQILLERAGYVKAYEVYLKAKRTCPAYTAFFKKLVL